MTHSGHSGHSGGPILAILVILVPHSGHSGSILVRSVALCWAAFDIAQGVLPSQSMVAIAQRPDELQHLISWLIGCPLGVIPLHFPSTFSSGTPHLPSPRSPVDNQATIPLEGPDQQRKHFLCSQSTHLGCVSPSLFSGAGAPVSGAPPVGRPEQGALRTLVFLHITCKNRVIGALI